MATRSSESKERHEGSTQTKMKHILRSWSGGKMTSIQNSTIGKQVGINLLQVLGLPDDDRHLSQRAVSPKKSLRKHHENEKQRPQSSIGTDVQKRGLPSNNKKQQRGTNSYIAIEDHAKKYVEPRTSTKIGVAKPMLANVLLNNDFVLFFVMVAELVGRHPMARRSLERSSMVTTARTFFSVLASPCQSAPVSLFHMHIRVAQGFMHMLTRFCAQSQNIPSARHVSPLLLGTSTDTFNLDLCSTQSDWNQINHTVRDSALEWTVWPSGRSHSSHNFSLLTWMIMERTTSRC